MFAWWMKRVLSADSADGADFFKSQISNLKSQISNLKSQISILNSQFSILNSQFSILHWSAATLLLIPNWSFAT